MHQPRRILFRLKNSPNLLIGRHELVEGLLSRPVKRIFLFVRFAVLEGGAFPVFFEQAVEVGQVVEALVADLADGQVRLDQQLAGMPDAVVDEKLLEAFVGALFKEMAEGGIRHVEPLSDVANL